MYKHHLLKAKIKFGFSLLEVMVALALLSIAFTSLVLVQARTTNLAVEARTISQATMLARYQLSECKREVQELIKSASDFKLDGDFADLGFEKFSWECHAPKFNMKAPSASQVEENVKKNTPENAKNNSGQQASVASPIMGMITDTLGQSVRELVVIIRWSEENIEDEMRVVTHVVDLGAMAGLSRMLSEGAKTFGAKLPKKADPGKGLPSPGRGRP